MKYLLQSAMPVITAKVIKPKDEDTESIMASRDLEHERTNSNEGNADGYCDTEPGKRGIYLDRVSNYQDRRSTLPTRCSLVVERPVLLMHRPPELLLIILIGVSLVGQRLNEGIESDRDLFNSVFSQLQKHWMPKTCIGTHRRVVRRALEACAN